MAANKFATMLHRNTNKMVVILVYVALEWILILLLLLNSLFSYLITKFAKWFGLKPPCFLCSRVDLDTNFHNDLVCETHAAEISNLSYCSNHQRLSETHNMCENCLASRPNHHERNSFGMRQQHRIALHSWVSHENEEENVNKCSCCNESLSSQLYSSSYLLMKPSWGDYKNYPSIRSHVVESIEEEKECDKDHEGVVAVADEQQILSDIESFILRDVGEDRSSSVSNLHSDEKYAEKDEKEDDHDLAGTLLNPSNADNFTHQFVVDRSIEVINMDFENHVTCDNHRLIPVKFIDSITCLNFESCKFNEYLVEGEQNIHTLDTDPPIEVQSSTSAGDDNADNADNAAAEEPYVAQDELPQSQEPIGESAQEDESQSSDDDAEIQDAFQEFVAQNNLEPTCLSESTPEDQSSESEDDTEVPNAFDDFIAQNNLCPDKTVVDDNNEYAEMIEKTILVEKNQEETSHQSSKCSESCELEEDKLPETPTSANGLHFLHRKLILFEKRESGVEDSGDGSVASEIEFGDPMLTIDRLKIALKAEQRALSVIYQELEEERSASAIATNQTMAMITRLQEEKAAMQMEALQYQRMMEEQAEYDQEALQLLNDLMMKREKEKRELEKELEEYRQKVMDYEAKDNLRLLKNMKNNGSIRSRESSCSCCNGNTDDLSIDLNHEAREEEEEVEDNNNATCETVSNLEEIALDCVKHVSTLDSTFEEFEEEKASILDQLKELEEKIIFLEDNEEFLDDIESSSTHGDKNLNEKCNFSSPEEYSNGFSDDKHFPRKTMGSLAKRLLPYLDAADNDNESENEEAYAFDRELESEVDNNKKVCIEEEVDRVYERLQALETDREFLHHCMGSIQNGGGKGSDLLQEILQHLRDLKAVELRMKNLSNDPL